MFVLRVTPPSHYKQLLMGKLQKEAGLHPCVQHADVLIMRSLKAFVFNTKCFREKRKSWTNSGTMKRCDQPQ